MTDATSDDDNKPPLKGIGGWLILPAIATCLSPLFVAKVAFDLLSAMSKGDFSNYTLSFQVLLYVELAVNVLLFCAWIYAIVLLFRHRALYPVLVISLMVFALAFAAIETAFLSLYFGAEFKVSDVREFVRGLVSAAIWIPYFVLSKRVQNTFVT